MKAFWKKGNGEFIAFAVLAPMICMIIIVIIGYIQLYSSLRQMTEALNVCSRSAAVSASMSEAEIQALLVAEGAISSDHISDLNIDIEYVTADNDWKNGVLIKVTLSCDIDTMAPYVLSGKRYKSAIVCIENSPVEINDDINLLAAIIASEAGTADRQTLLAIGSVIMNRVNSGAYPNTIAGVIRSSQFLSYNSDMYNRYLRNGAPALTVNCANDCISGIMQEDVRSLHICNYMKHISEYGDTTINAEDLYPRGIDIGGFWFYW